MDNPRSAGGSSSGAKVQARDGQCAAPVEPIEPH